MNHIVQFHDEFYPRQARSDLFQVGYQRGCTGKHPRSSEVQYTSGYLAGRRRFAIKQLIAGMAVASGLAFTGIVALCCMLGW